MRTKLLVMFTVVAMVFVHLRLLLTLSNREEQIEKEENQNAIQDSIQLGMTLGHEPELHINYTIDNILDFIHLDWHPTERKDRFPTVAERVKIYMSNWYSPPCDKSTLLDYRIEYNGSFSALKVLQGEYKEQHTYESIIDNHIALLLHRPLLDQCSKNNFTHPRVKKVSLNYCLDTLALIDIGDKISNTWFPYVSVFGDGVYRSRTVPIFAKCRYRTTRDNLATVTNRLDLIVLVHILCHFALH